MKKELKDMTDFWNEQHKDNQYFDCKNNYKYDLTERYNNENTSLTSMGLDDGIWGSNTNSSNAFFDLKKNGKDLKVLEIGCGYGGFGASLARYVKIYDGIDISKEIIENGNISIKEANIKNMNLYHAKDCDISFLNDCSYDIIFSSGVFIHTETDVTIHYLVETKRLLKSDGFFIHHLNVTDSLSINEFYNKIYNINECNKLFLNNGLSIVKTRDGIFFKNNYFMRYYIGNK